MVGNDVVMPLGFMDVLNPLDTVVSQFFFQFEFRDSEQNLIRSLYFISCKK